MYTHTQEETQRPPVWQRAVTEPRQQLCHLNAVGQKRCLILTQVSHRGHTGIGEHVKKMKSSIYPFAHLPSVPVVTAYIPLTAVHIRFTAVNIKTLE